MSIKSLYRGEIGKVNLSGEKATKIGTHINQKELGKTIYIIKKRENYTVS